MIESEKIAELLAEQQSLIATLAGRKVGGFFIIVPPEGDPVTQIILGTDPTMQAFFKALADRCAEAQKPADSGAYVRGGR